MAKSTPSKSQKPVTALTPKIYTPDFQVKDRLPSMLLDTKDHRSRIYAIEDYLQVTSVSLSLMLVEITRLQERCDVLEQQVHVLTSGS